MGAGFRPVRVTRPRRAAGAPKARPDRTMPPLPPSVDTDDSRPCPGCGYDLRGQVSGARCPECGMVAAAASITASRTALAPALTRAEQIEVGFSELGTAAAGTVLLWAGCVWLPLLGPIAWAVVGMFAFWRLAGMRRLRQLGILDAQHMPFPVPHALGLCIIEVSIAVPTILVTAVASFGILSTVLQPAATVLQVLLIAATGGQLCVSALLAGTVARREGVSSLRVASQAALLLAPVGTLVLVPIAVQWLSGSGALTGKAATALSASMTAIMLALGAGGIVAALALRVALHGLSSVVPSGVDAPKATRRSTAPLPPPTKPDWADASDDPIPLADEEPPPEGAQGRVGRDT